MAFATGEIVPLPVRRRRRTSEQRAALIGQIRMMRAQGMTYRAIALDLGLNPQTVYSWRDELGGEAPGFQAVAITMPRPTTAPVLVTPQGYRIEGLDLSGVAQLLRALG
jgi:transposase-like protein